LHAGDDSGGVSAGHLQPDQNLQMQRY
jgi:hypothetical protein